MPTYCFQAELVAVKCKPNFTSQSSSLFTLARLKAEKPINGGLNNLKGQLQNIVKS